MALTAAKQRILEVALDTFSNNGYDATSVGQIADALGIKKPSLYSHFESKRALFEMMMEEMTKRFEEHGLPALYGELETEISQEKAVEIALNQVHFLLHDPYISKVRHLLTMEQFRDEELGKLMEKRSYTDVMNYHVKFIKGLVKSGILQDGDLEIMALTYFSPISMQIYRVDRNPACEQEAIELIRKHIAHFFTVYAKHK